MIASQTVYLTEDRKRAVREGDAKAKFKLIHEGHEIADSEVEKYDGAAELLGATKKAPRKESAVETRTPAVTHRDPRTRRRA